MAVAARLQEVFEEFEQAQPVREIILALPANATDNQIAAITKEYRTKALAWEERARASVDGLVAWENPSPGIRDIQRASANYLRAVRDSFLVRLGRDLSDLSSALNDPDRKVSREAALELGAEILQLRNHQLNVLDELTGSLDACLSEATETNATEAIEAAPSPQLSELVVAVTLPSDGLQTSEVLLLLGGCAGVILALVGVALPWLNHTAALIVAPVGFSLWWAASEALKRGHNAEA